MRRYVHKAIGKAANTHMIQETGKEWKKGVKNALENKVCERGEGRAGGREEWEERGIGEVCSAGELGEENHRKELEGGKTREEGVEKNYRERPDQGDRRSKCFLWEEESLMSVCVVPEDSIKCDMSWMF